MKTLLLTSVGALVVGCGGEGAGVQTQAAPLTVSNGWTYTGISYGGYSLQSVSLSTFSAATYSTSLSTDVDPVAGLGPNGTSLDGVSAELQGVLESGEPVQLRVVARAALTIRGQDVPYQQVEIRGGADQPWSPLCGLDVDGTAKWALTLPGSWDTSIGTRWSGAWEDTDGFSFACQGSSVAKCVELGYGLAAARGEDVPSFAHRGCVRALRADYCGDGTSWTTNGRLLDMWDTYGINQRSQSDWTFEATWTGTGAKCISNARLMFPSGSTRPGCLRKIAKKSCAEDGAGADVITAFAPMD